jgi:hypothetical protein
MGIESSPSPAWTAWQLAVIAAGQRMAGEEPTAADLDATRRVLTGEATAFQVIACGLAALEAEHGFTRRA